ncbi:MAG: nucleotide exchange factor GrpE [Oscillospiraceae bacterium]
MQQHKNGYIEKEFVSFALDMIGIIEIIQKNCELFQNTPCTQERYDKLLSYYSGICEDINDILYRHNIEPFSCFEPTIDVTKQKIVKTEETKHKKKDKTIAARLSQGYEKDNKVIKQERISIFSYDGNKHLK